MYGSTRPLTLLTCLCAYLDTMYVCMDVSHRKGGWHVSLVVAGNMIVPRRVVKGMNGRTDDTRSSYLSRLGILDSADLHVLGVSRFRG